MLETETKIPLSAAAARLGKKLGGHRPHVSTVWRWGRRGVQGVRLELARYGRTFYTSEPALDRFAEALARIELPERPCREPASRSRSEIAREKAIERAKATLKAAGV